MDVGSLNAIDFHAHVGVSVRPGSGLAGYQRAMAEVFKAETVASTLPELAGYYRERRMACVAFTVDASSATGEPPPVSNDEVLQLAAEHADVVIPFISVDPWGRDAVAEVRRLAGQYPVRGVKFHPNLQAFFPNDRTFYPLYEALVEHRLIALFHSGHTAVGAGQRGGGGIRLKYSNPMFVDDVAVDFPDLPIVLAHPSFPWQDEALSVALHKPAVHIDLSGWSPKYFPPTLVQHANTLLRHKVLFGSDYPALTPDRWLADFAGAGFRDEVRPLILKDNAAKLLGL